MSASGAVIEQSSAPSSSHSGFYTRILAILVHISSSTWSTAATGFDRPMMSCDSMTLYEITILMGFWRPCGAISRWSKASASRRQRQIRRLRLDGPTIFRLIPNQCRRAFFRPFLVPNRWKCSVMQWICPTSHNP
jgi:hypothetical protein